MKNFFEIFISLFIVCSFSCGGKNDSLSMIQNEDVHPNENIGILDENNSSNNDTTSTLKDKDSSQIVKNDQSLDYSHIKEYDNGVIQNKHQLIDSFYFDTKVNNKSFNTGKDLALDVKNLVSCFLCYEDLRFNLLQKQLGRANIYIKCNTCGSNIANDCSCPVTEIRNEENNEEPKKTKRRLIRLYNKKENDEKAKLMHKEYKNECMNILYNKCMFSNDISEVIFRYMPPVKTLSVFKSLRIKKDFNLSLCDCITVQSFDNEEDIYKHYELQVDLLTWAMCYINGYQREAQFLLNPNIDVLNWYIMYNGCYTYIINNSISDEKRKGILVGPDCTHNIQYKCHVERFVDCFSSSQRIKYISANESSFNFLGDLLKVSIEKGNDKENLQRAKKILKGLLLKYLDDNDVLELSRLLENKEERILFERFLLEVLNLKNKIKLNNTNLFIIVEELFKVFEKQNISSTFLDKIVNKTSNTLKRTYKNDYISSFPGNESCTKYINNMTQHISIPLFYEKLINIVYKYTYTKNQVDTIVNTILDNVSVYSLNRFTLNSLWSKISSDKNEYLLKRKLCLNYLQSSDYLHKNNGNGQYFGTIDRNDLRWVDYKLSSLIKKKPVTVDNILKIKKIIKGHPQYDKKQSFDANLDNMKYHLFLLNVIENIELLKNYIKAPKYKTNLF